MFEQLDDDFFDNLYQGREVECGKVNQHKIIDLAIIPWSIGRIESEAEVVFFSHDEKGATFDSVVIGYEGRECFLLTSQRCSQLKPETAIQCSSLIDVSLQQGIVKFVLSKLGLNKENLSWIKADIDFLQEDASFVEV